MLVLLLSVGAIHFKNHPTVEEYFIEMVSQEKEKDIAEKKTPPQPPKKGAKVTHKTYNDRIKSRYSKEDNYQSLDKFFSELESKKATERVNTKQPNTEGYGNLQAAEESRKRANKALEDLKKDGKGVQNRNTERTATVTYSLVDRIVSGRIPNPTYTCIEGGIVVITIKVNQYGNVISAKQNEASSTTTDGCLVENAIHYAMRTKFNANPQKRLQVGTISYVFQQK